MGRFLQGLGTGCCAVLARASTRDRFSGDELPVAMSYIAMAASITPLIAPVIGGFINFHFGWSMVFISLLGYVSLAWVIIAFKFTETIAKRSVIPSPRNMLFQYRDLVTSRYFMSFASISWLNFSLMITTVSVMPFIMQDQIGMTSDQYAMWALIPALGMLGGTTICNRVRPIIGNKRMLLCSPFLHLSAAIWLFFCPVEPLYLMLGQLLMILGNGIALPCAQAMVMQPYKKQAGCSSHVWRWTNDRILIGQLNIGTAWFKPSLASINRYCGVCSNNAHQYSTRFWSRATFRTVTKRLTIVLIIKNTSYKL